jgi:hypothetical protein
VLVGMGFSTRCGNMKRTILLTCLLSACSMTAEQKAEFERRWACMAYEDFVRHEVDDLEDCRIEACGQAVRNRIEWHRKQCQGEE